LEKSESFEERGSGRRLHDSKSAVQPAIYAKTVADGKGGGGDMKTD